MRTAQRHAEKESGEKALCCNQIFRSEREEEEPRSRDGQRNKRRAPTEANVAHLLPTHGLTDPDIVRFFDLSSRVGY